MSGDDYSDIINLPHHVSKRHPQMPRTQRAAQFAPFAALTGYEDEIKEEGRTTEQWDGVDADAIDSNNEKAAWLLAHLGQRPRVTIAWFEHDRLKEGGEYRSVTGTLTAVDEQNRTFVIDRRIVIPMPAVTGIEILN